MDTADILFKFLKKKRIVSGSIETFSKDTIVETICLRKPIDLFIRDAITGLGTILLENLDEHYYITSVKVGIGSGVLAYALILRHEETAEIISYAHEGLIKQHLAQKATDKLKTKLV